MEISKGFTSARGLVAQVDYAGEMSWSPDSKWISFISSENRPARKTNQIYKVSVQTNELFQITAFPEGTVIGDSTTWSANGLIGFEKEGIIYGVSPTGGNEVQLLDTRTALSNQRPSYIRFSPEGKMMVFSAENAEQNQSSLWLGDLQSRTIRRLTDLHFDLYPTWIDEGHVLFTRQNKNKWSQIEVLSLGTGHMNQITSKHLDLTPSADPSGNVLYFSRKGPTPKGLENTDFFVGFHIWRVAIPSKVVR
jgi:Tol biopolymer transport system component